VLRRFWEGSVLESIGGTWLGIGVGVVAAVLLMPRMRKRVGEWGEQIGQGLRDIVAEAREHPGLVIGSAALGATAAAATAPAGGAGAAAATAAPTVAALIPVALEAVEHGLEARSLVDSFTGTPHSEADY
jgi:hypothetical protein